MNEFKTYHPIVNLFYFLFTIIFSCLFMHPVCLSISIGCSFAYSVILGGKKTFKSNLIYMIPMIILTAMLNPLFNHEGVTIIRYLPNGNPLTLESVVYGVLAAVMIASVICWFSCYNRVMTSDKFIYLFGRIIPALSLIISMTLRFVPRFTAQIKTVSASQKLMGRDISSGNIIKRASCGLSILSIMITWSLENAVETADSMKARGYGFPGRTAFSIYKFDRRDLSSLCAILFLATYILAGYILGVADFNCFPVIKSINYTPYTISVFSAYFLLCAFPIIIELWEVRRWKALKSKI